MKNHLFILLAYILFGSLAIGQTPLNHNNGVLHPKPKSRNQSSHILQPIENSSNQIKCATDELHQARMAVDLPYKQITENFIQEWGKGNFVRPRDGVYKIPVVVHVLYTNDYDVTDDQVILGIKALNEFWRKVPGSVGDGMGVDMEIEFALAVRDPSGNCTNGIVRRNMNSIPSYVANGVGSPGFPDEDIKTGAWPTNQYYNIYLVNKIDGNNCFSGGGYTAGYAYYAEGSHGQPWDGTVCLMCSYIDPTSTTMAHELGHALSLRHTFEGNTSSCTTETNCNTQGDLICDTRPHQQTDCAGPGCTGSGTFPNSANNYMSYCGNTSLFTAGQKDFATFTLLNSRPSFLAANGNNKLIPPAAPTVDFNVSASAVCLGTPVQFTDISTCIPNTYATNAEWPNHTFSWTFNGPETYNSNDQNPIVTFGEAGAYDVTLTITNTHGTFSETKQNYIVVSSGVVATSCNPTSFNNGFNYGAGITNVSLGSINHTSSTFINATAENFTCSQSTTLISEDTYPLSVTFIARSESSQELEVWIDWDNNGIFQTNNSFGVNERVLVDLTLPSTSKTASVSITPPALAPKNTMLRMRVISDFEDEITLCGQGFLQQTKDYGIVVVDPPVTVDAPPTANFSATPLQVNDGGTVQFTDLSTGSPSITDWAWTITGPGTATPSNPTTQNPIVEFNGVGFYTVSLTVTNTEGSDTETKTAYIEVVDLVCHDPISSAYTQSFELSDDLTGWGVVDANGDGTTWGIADFTSAPQGAQHGDRVLVYFFNEFQNANDWIVSPCFSLQASTTYTLTYYRTTGAGYAENLSVYLGTSTNPADMTVNLQTLSNISNSNWVQETVTINVATDGNYYLGWHCTSIADQWFIAIDAINISVQTANNEPCAATSTGCDEYISNVTLEEINNTSGCTNYGDYTSQIANLTKEQQYTVSITPRIVGNPEPATLYPNDEIAVWIDFNDDGVFDDATERVGYVLASGTFDPTFTFTVPANAVTGHVRMRCRISYLPDDGSITSCGTSQWGEVEDYTINILDPVTPTGITITFAPANTTISCEESINPSTTGQLTATTDCISGGLDISYSDNTTAGSCANASTIVRTWTITDNCGNNETHVQTITINDLIAPSLNCGIANDELFTVGGTIALPNYVTGATYSDNCTPFGSLIVTQNPVAGTLVSTNQNVVISVTDACGNNTTCQINVTVTDNEFITITSAPANTTISCEDSTDPANTGMLTAASGCISGGLDISYSDNTTAGSCANASTILRTWTIIDNCGNNETHVQTITINDLVAPLINCGISSDEIQTPTTTALVPDYSAGISYSDNCSDPSDITVVQLPAAGTELGFGVHTIEFEATDECGNTATCSITLTILSDNGITVFTVPTSSLTLECDDDLSPANTGGEPTAASTCLGILTIDYADVSVGDDCNRTVTRTWTITDECSNIETATQTIQLEDTTPPTGNPLADIQVACVGNIPVADASSVISSDNCTNTPQVVHLSDASDNNTCPETITRTYRMTDDCGNFADITQSIIVLDEVSPQISCTMTEDSFVSSQTNDVTCPNYLSTVIATDNCGTVNISQNPAAGTVLSTGVTMVQLRAEDDCGNIAFCNIQVTVSSNVGITELEAHTIKVYPNPATDMLIVNFENEVHTKFHISLFDYTGKLVFDKHITSDGIYKMDTSPYATGLYNLQIRYGSNVITEKISIQK